MATTQQQFIIRATDHTLSFALRKEGEQSIEHEDYAVKRGMAVAANLREAFHDSRLLRAANSEAVLTTDSPVLLVAVDEYDEKSMMEQYKYAFPASENIVLRSTLLSSLRTMAVFALDKDLAVVLGDHFSTVHIEPLMARLWTLFLRRQEHSTQEKMYVYLHENKVEIASFVRRRFAFANVFVAENAPDAAYFICGAWQQVNAHAATDSLIVCGDLSDEEALDTALRQYIPHVTFCNAASMLGKMLLSSQEHIPLDLLLHFV